MIQDLLNKIKIEEERNTNVLHVTANEAQMSETARMFLGSKLSERYYMGAGEDGLIDLHPFTALGFPGVFQLVNSAQIAVKDMLGASIVNLNMLSGVHAMMCAILSTTNPGDTIMTVRHEDGGHFATTGIIRNIGRKHIDAAYDLSNLRFDVEQIAMIFKKTRAKAFYMDVSYYINPHNLRDIRRALGEKAIIIYDASHTMGLIMGQAFQSPLREGANVICANTHKTLPGPQKGMIAFRDADLGEQANNIINSCLYSSPHLHHLIALSTTILEMKAFGREYAQQVIINSNSLGKAFADLGYRVRRTNTNRFSENHQVHVFLKNSNQYHVLYSNLVKNNISTNFDQVLGTDIFIRLGTQEITRRGMKEKEMQTIASFIDSALTGANIKKDVVMFNKQFSKIFYSFDV